MNESFVRLMFALTMAMIGLAVHAQPSNPAVLRDPTEPPEAARIRIPTGDTREAQVSPPTPRHIVVINGREYVINQGLRLSAGDELGSARIERIDNNSVWLREGGVVRQLPLYPGVHKRALVPGDSAKVKSPYPPRSKSKDKQS